MPALLTSTSTDSPEASTSLANCLTLWRDETSHTRRDTFLFPVASATFCTAASPFSLLRQTITSVQPRRARSCHVHFRNLFGDF